jgi:hypothetical protein
MDANKLHVICQILSSYPTNAADTSVAAEHDRIWIGGPSPADLSREDAATMERLGVHWDARHESWWVFT